jgi:uncharacterized phiE125 gp8 family phage protein
VTANDDDQLINKLIDAATLQAEIYTWRRFVTQTWDYFIDDFSDKNTIPYGELQSITSVKYYDSTNSQQTLSTSVYDTVTDSDPGVVNLSYSQTWPFVYDRQNAVEIRFVCGYGASSAVPESIKSAIKIKLELLYGNLFMNEREQLESTFKSLLDPYRIVEFC